MNIGSLPSVCLSEAYLPDKRWRKEHPIRYKLYKSLYYPMRVAGQGLGYIAKGFQKIEDTAPMRKLALFMNDPGKRHQTAHNVMNVAAGAAYGGHLGSQMSSKHSGTAAAIGAVAGGLVGDYATQHDKTYLKSRDWTEKERKAAEDKFIEDMRKRHKETDRFLNSFSNDMKRTYRGY